MIFISFTYTDLESKEFIREDITIPFEYFDDSEQFIKMKKESDKDKRWKIPSSIMC
jgi:hypothetical protein